jgi:uncharacterized protein YdeI (YjbR/CyaY-like superfamily)
LSRESSKSFQVVLEATGTSLHWVVARVPVDLKKAWPEWKTRRVLGQINGYAFRTSLFPGPKGVRHTLLVNKRMQAGAKARAGDRVRICLEPDLEKQVLVLSKELASELKSDKQVQRWFERLSLSMQKGISQYIDQAKRAATRRQRAEEMTESLMLAMDGELELPPILRVAFQRQPLAPAGWQAMTPTQRRNHLLGIFYVQTVEGRQRRAAKAAEEAARLARKKMGDRR